LGRVPASEALIEAITQALEEVTASDALVSSSIVVTVYWLNRYEKRFKAHLRYTAPF
jgi:hypothetical protein